MGVTRGLSYKFCVALGHNTNRNLTFFVFFTIHYVV